MLTVIPLPVLKDNYIWIVQSQSKAGLIVVDPGTSLEVLNYAKLVQQPIIALFITHHHRDHTGGIEELLHVFPDMRIYGPALENIRNLTDKLSEKNYSSFEALGVNWRVLDIPGHTKGHIAFIHDEILFCGDTLFSCGCGRLFEGSPGQMVASLKKISELPPNTHVYCAHEYTLNNIAFAKTVEPDNTDLDKRLKDVSLKRSKGLPSLPSRLLDELRTNPFLRLSSPSIIRTIQQKYNENGCDLTTIFTHLRHMKDVF